MWRHSPSDTQEFVKGRKQMQTRLTVARYYIINQKQKGEEKITLSRPPDHAKRNARSWQNLEREGEKGAA